MNHRTIQPAPRSWIEKSGCLHIFRTLRLALNFNNLTAAFISIALTFATGLVLDSLYRAGENKARLGDVDLFMLGQESPEPLTQPNADEDHGVFTVFLDHETKAILGLLESAVPFADDVGEAFGVERMMPHAGLSPWMYLQRIWYGPCWMLMEHTWYCLFFSFAMLVIWSWGGGIITRTVAVRFARDQLIPWKDAHSFAKDKMLGGFCFATLLPPFMIAFTMALMFFHGMVLGIPYVGDWLGGLAFVLAIIGGFFAAAVTVGFFAGGPLFWSAVATEGQDGFDAFARGLSCALSKPWKTLIYATIATVFTGICWMAINLFVQLAFGLTRAGVGFGTSAWGAWSQTSAEGQAVSKLDLIWPAASPGVFYNAPAFSQLGGGEWFSGFMIGLYVLIVAGLVWSFLVSMYFTNATVIYFLLRRDVDGTDLEEVQFENYDDAGQSQTPPSTFEQTASAIASKPTPAAHDSPSTQESSETEQTTQPTTSTKEKEQAEGMESAISDSEAAGEADAEESKNGNKEEESQP